MTIRFAMPRCAAAMFAALALAGAWSISAAAQDVDPGFQSTDPAEAAMTTGNIHADNACYVRLPDMPAARSGGFGAYNPLTRVLAYAGGTEKRGSGPNITKYDMQAIRLDGAATRWASIPYGDGGYTRQARKGCSSLTNVQVDASRWLSVFGKGGCDNGAFDKRGKSGGDIKELEIGGDATPSEVRWVPGSGAQQLPDELMAYKGKLSNPFAAYDTDRDRLIFGQGTFNAKLKETTNEEVYAAAPIGAQWQIRQLRPDGPIPERRHSSCGAYVADADLGLNGVVVIGGQGPAPKGAPAPTFKQVWWLDFTDSQDGRWLDVTERFPNMDDFGGRYGSACAYDPGSHMLYTWMGRTTPIPDGASRSSGVWRVSLAELAETSAPLEWERLAKDNTAGVQGRSGIPNLWDHVNQRILVVGGSGKDTYKDAFAIYPDVTGAECDALDPYAPFGSTPDGATQ